MLWPHLHGAAGTMLARCQTAGGGVMRPYCGPLAGRSPTDPISLRQQALSDLEVRASHSPSAIQ